MRAARTGLMDISWVSGTLQQQRLRYTKHCVLPGINQHFVGVGQDPTSKRKMCPKMTCQRPARGPNVGPRYIAPRWAKIASRCGNIGPTQSHKERDREGERDRDRDRQKER